MNILFIITIMAVVLIGTITVHEVYAVEEDIEEVTQLTINSLEIYEDADYTRYRVTGDAPASTEITFKTTKPDGLPGNYPGSIDTSKPAYIVDNKIDTTNNLVYGLWTLEVCIPEYDVCVQESFTINEPLFIELDLFFVTFSILSENIPRFLIASLILDAFLWSALIDDSKSSKFFLL